MIFYNYSFNKQKIIQFLKKEKIIDGVIYTPINSKLSIDQVIMKIENDIPIIFDNPIYLSSMLDIDSDEVKKRNLDKFIFDKRNILNENINKEILMKLNNYAEEVKEKSVQTVLSIPLDNILINKNIYDDIINEIIDINYDHLSININSNESKEILNKKKEIILKFINKFGINSLLLSIKTNRHDEAISSLTEIQHFINELVSKNISIIMHHSLNYFHLFENIDSVTACGFKQGNSVSLDVAPFADFPPFARSTQWFYSSISFCQVSRGKLENLTPLFKNNNFIKDILKELEDTEKQFPKIEKPTYINEIITFSSLKKISSKNLSEIALLVKSAKDNRQDMTKADATCFRSIIK